MSEAQSLGVELLLDSCRNRFVDPVDGYAAFVGHLRELEDGKPDGVKTHIPELDAVLTSLRPGSLTVIAGETANGKTSLALSIAIAQAKAGVNVLFASLEVPFEELEAKITSHVAGVSFAEVEGAGKKDLAHAKRVVKAAEDRSRWPLAVMDCPSLTVEELETRIKAYTSCAFQPHKCDVVFVDYLQLMSGETGGSREREVSKLSRGLKALARSLSIPVVALSQLRRIDPRAEDHRPTLERLRDSGQIEQDASVVLGVFWPHRYSEEEDWGMAEVSVLKNRNGPCKVIPAQVNWEAGQFFVGGENVRT